MPETYLTPRLALPLLAAGQAQKELTHNEALVLIDALLLPAAQGGPSNTPPESPEVGHGWMVDSAPSGAWLGHPMDFAVWTAAGWRFATPPIGTIFPVGVTRIQYRRTATGWTAASPISGPAGGAIVDLECRAAVNQVLIALREAGIIDNS